MKTPFHQMPSAIQTAGNYTLAVILDKVNGSMAGWMKSDCGKQLYRLRQSGSGCIKP